MVVAYFSVHKCHVKEILKELYSDFFLVINYLEFYFCRDVKFIKYECY